MMKMWLNLTHNLLPFLHLDSLLVLAVISYLTAAFPYEALRWPKPMVSNHRADLTVGAGAFPAIFSKSLPPQAMGQETWRLGLAGRLLAGLASATLARLEVGTGTAWAVVAFFAYLGGERYPLAPRLVEKPVKAGFLTPGTQALWGALWSDFPLAAIFLGLFAFVVYRLAPSPHLGGHLAFHLALPAVLWWSRGNDLLLSFGLVMTMIGVNTVLAEKEEWRGLRLALVRGTGMLVLLGGILLFTLNRYVYRGWGWQHRVIRQGPESYAVVALTFDDGPDPRYTPLVLDILKREGVRATFFVVGKHAEAYPDLIQRMVAEGHEVGNHSYHHRNLFLLPADKMHYEVEATEKALLRITGKRPTLFRPPRGLYNRNLLHYLHRRGYSVVLWTVSSLDWAEISSRSIAAAVTKHIRNGDIILFHDSGSLLLAEGGNRNNTIKALPVVIKTLKKEGYAFLTITELNLLRGLTGESSP